MILQRDATYVNYGRNVNMGHESEKTPQTRPSNKNIQTLNELYMSNHRQHLKNIPNLKVKDDMEYGFRPPNKHIEGGKFGRGAEKVKHFFQGVGQGVKAVAPILPLIL